MNETVQGVVKFSKGINIDSAAELYAYNSEPPARDYTAQRSSGLPTRKPFIYLTETEQCLPSNLATSSQIGDPETCNCDVIVLSYRVKCQENKRSHIKYLFDPNTLFASGRNVLFFAAMDRRPGYHYYIFINDDTVLKYNIFTPANMTKMSPFRAVEKWLLDYEPAVGVLDYAFNHGANTVLKKRKDFCGINKTSLVLPTVFFDAIFNAFHHKAVEHILPYPTQYERECIFASHRDTMIAVEVKFGGQALLFAPVTAGNPKHHLLTENRFSLLQEETPELNIRNTLPPPLPESHARNVSDDKSNTVTPGHVRANLNDNNTRDGTTQTRQNNNNNLQPRRPAGDGTPPNTANCTAVILCDSNGRF
ncbi:hypothetical protein ACROYT_G017794 [Oculina patagonica]